MEGTILNSNRNPRDNRDLSETPWCQADWKVTFNMPTTFPLCLTRKKQSARQKRDAHPRQTSRIVTFVYVFLTLFYAIFSMVKSHACYVEAYRVTCVTLWEFRSPRLRSLACMHASPFCGRNRSRPVCSQLVQAQWVRPAVSLACRTRNSWFTNPSEAWNHPNPTKHVGRVIDVCNTKDG